MKSTLIFTLLAALVAFSCAAPFGLNDIFPGFVGNARLASPAEKEEPVKRQVEGNPDGELKQISFNSLIGNLENSLFQSALSVHGASGPDTEVTEVKPGAVSAVASESGEHGITKRSDEATTERAATDKILVQTTKKVPSDEGVPAHLIIDRVSVQPHSGGVPLIPTFQVHHTKLVSATIKEASSGESSDGKQTKISITKTSITSTAAVESPEGQSSTVTIVTPQTPKTEGVTTITVAQSTDSSSSSTSAAPSSTSTEKPIEKLKKVEEQLKEKVAEVEAEPIILSARV